MCYFSEPIIYSLFLFSYWCCGWEFNRILNGSNSYNFRSSNLLFLSINFVSLNIKVKLSCNFLSFQGYFHFLTFVSIQDPSYFFIFLCRNIRFQNFFKALNLICVFLIPYICIDRIGIL